MHTQYMTSSRRLSVAALAASIALAVATPAIAADNTSQIAEAKQMLMSERYVEALAAAKDALRADPSDFRGEYYVAMALMGLGQLDEAETAAKRSLSMAPEISRASVQKLIGSIASLRTGSGHLSAAEEALAEGLTGKAARLYSEAWNAGKNNPELALKAAELYAGKLDQPVSAAQLLREAKAADTDGLYAPRIDSLLDKLAPQLSKIAELKISTARNAGFTEALALLQEAEDTYPAHPEIYRTRAHVIARGTDFDALKTAVVQLAQRELATAKELSDLPQLSRWAEHAEFRTLIEDLLGAAKATEVWSNTRQGLLKQLDGTPRWVQVRGCYESACESEGQMTFWAEVTSEQFIDECKLFLTLAAQEHPAGRDSHRFRNRHLRWSHEALQLGCAR
jgi:hypothetical protein